VTRNEAVGFPPPWAFSPPGNPWMKKEEEAISHPSGRGKRRGKKGRRSGRKKRKSANVEMKQKGKRKKEVVVLNTVRDQKERKTEPFFSGKKKEGVVSSRACCAK